MKWNFTLFLFVIFFNISFAQEQPYYYYKGEKILLTYDTRTLDISTTTNFNRTSFILSNFKKFAIKNEEVISGGPTFGYSKIAFEVRPKKDEYFRKLRELKKNPGIRIVSPNFFAPNGKELGMSDFFYVKLKDKDDYKLLSETAKKNNVTIVEQNKFMPLWYTLRCTSESPNNSLEIANIFYETGYFL